MRCISPMEYQSTAESVHWYQSYHWYQWTAGIPRYSYLIHCENILSPLNEMHFTNGVLTDCQASPLESVHVYWTILVFLSTHCSSVSTVALCPLFLCTHFSCVHCSSVPTGHRGTVGTVDT